MRNGTNLNLNVKALKGIDWSIGSHFQDMSVSHIPEAHRWLPEKHWFGRDGRSHALLLPCTKPSAPRQDNWRQQFHTFPMLAMIMLMWMVGCICVHSNEVCEGESHWTQMELVQIPVSAVL